jgi:VWFA-related protein
VFVGGVSLVSVDVSVLDQDGRPVPGLSAEDFEIRFNGARQPVRALSYDSVTASAPVPPAALSVSHLREVTNTVRPPEGRIFVVLVDDISMPASRGKPLFFAASRFIDSLPAGDVAGMTTSSGLLTVNPTRDHAGVAAALRRSLGVYIDPRDMAIPGLTGHPPAFTSPALTADAQLRAYLNVIDAMRMAPGLKTLVLISDGLALAPRDERMWCETIARTAASSGVQVSVIAQEPDGPSTSEWPILRVPEPHEDTRARLAGIQTIADLTGGRFYRVSGAPDAAFTRVSLASAGLYHLGVQSPVDAVPGSDYQLSAKVARDGVTVHANRHAVAPVDDTAPLPLDRRLETSVVNGSLAYGVPITLATVVRRSSTTADSIDLGANVEVPAAVSGPLTVMFGLVDATGAVMASRKTVPKPPEGNYRLSFLLQVVPGRYQLRFAAADTNGHVGSLGMGVKAEFSSLGPFLASDVLTSWSVQDGRPQFLALEEVPMRALALQSFLELYPAGPAPKNVRVDWTLLGSDGQPLAAESVAPVRSADRLTAAASFPLTALRAGAYEVRANVYVDGVSVGATSTTVRKTDKTPAPFWMPFFEHCRRCLFEPIR